MASNISNILRRPFATSSSTTAASIKANCRKVVCIGRNYADHITELNSAKPQRPFFFLKPPSSILLPNSGSVLRPRGTTLHYEVELGLVIGQELRDLDPADEEKAMGAISHYLLCVDMTARNVQDQAKKKGLPWTIAKGFDTFLPVSEVISKSVFATEGAKFEDPYRATLWLTVNNEHRQNDKIELMLWRIPRILSDISAVMGLEPGDIVLTGTPKGVGPVESGDVMRAGLQIDGKDVQEASLEIPVEDSKGLYEYSET